MKFRSQISLALVFSIIHQSIQPVFAQGFAQSYETLSAIYQRLETAMDRQNLRRDGLFRFGENYRKLNQREVDYFIESLDRMVCLAPTASVPIARVAREVEPNQKISVADSAEIVFVFCGNKDLEQLQESYYALRDGERGQRPNQMPVNKTYPAKTMAILSASIVALAGLAPMLVWMACENGAKYSQPSGIPTCSDGSTPYHPFYAKLFGLGIFIAGAYTWSYVFKDVISAWRNPINQPGSPKIVKGSGFGACQTPTSQMWTFDQRVAHVGAKFGVPFLKEIFIYLFPLVTENPESQDLV